MDKTTSPSCRQMYLDLLSELRMATPDGPPDFIQEQPAAGGESMADVNHIRYTMGAYVGPKRIPDERFAYMSRAIRQRELHQRHLVPVLCPSWRLCDYTVHQPKKWAT